MNGKGASEIEKNWVDQVFGTVVLYLESEQCSFTVRKRDIYFELFTEFCSSTTYFVAYSVAFCFHHKNKVRYSACVHKLITPHPSIFSIITTKCVIRPTDRCVWYMCAYKRLEN